MAMAFIATAPMERERIKEYEWFAKYLSGRTQVVGFRGFFRELSQRLDLLLLMYPTGGSLDLLTVLHVNELPIIAYRCSMPMYADDTVLFYSGKPADPIKKSLNEDLTLIMIISIFITTPFYW